MLANFGIGALAFRRIEPIAVRIPLAFLLISLTIIASVWWWLAKPVTLARAPIDSTAKLECVSYAPFRDGQTPLNPNVEVTTEQIREDLVHLAGISRCIRTYSVDNGLNKVPQLASEVGTQGSPGNLDRQQPRQECAACRHGGCAG